MSNLVSAPELTIADFSQYMRYAVASSEISELHINQLTPSYRAKLKTALDTNESHPVNVMTAVLHQEPALLSLTLDVNEMVKRIRDYVDTGRGHSFNDVQRLCDAVYRDEKTPFTGHAPTKEQSERYRAIYLAHMVDQNARYSNHAKVLMDDIIADFDSHVAAAPIIFARSAVDRSSSPATIREAVDLALRHPSRFHEITAFIMDRKSFDSTLIEVVLASNTPALSDGHL